MATGLEIGRDAEGYEMEGQYPLALSKYESALGILLPELGNEPQGRRKTLLNCEVKKWLQRAEAVKQMVRKRK